MKVLIVCSGNSSNICFITDQATSLESIGIDTALFLIKGSGIMGYLKNYKALLQKIHLFNPDIIHAHYGLSGLLSVFQQKVPVVITFHGSDINSKKIRLLSRPAILLSKLNIYVSERLRAKAKDKNGHIVPCGIDTSLFQPIDKIQSRSLLQWEGGKDYILFSSGFDNPVKNSALAIKAVEFLANSNVQLVQLTGYSRKEMAWLYNAADVVLMTSFNEGSPQIIKEAMACNTPIISTDVGDVASLTASVDGCFITNYEVEEVAKSLRLALDFAKHTGKTRGREIIFQKGLDEDTIATRIADLYQSILNNTVNKS